MTERTYRRSKDIQYERRGYAAIRARIDRVLKAHLTWVQHGQRKRDGDPPEPATLEILDALQGMGALNAWQVGVDSENAGHVEEVAYRTAAELARAMLPSRDPGSFNGVSVVRMPCNWLEVDRDDAIRLHTGQCEECKQRARRIQLAANPPTGKLPVR